MTIDQLRAADIRSVSFGTLDAALKFAMGDERTFGGAGGWIVEPTSGGLVWWFDPAHYTMSKIQKMTKHMGSRRIGTWTAFINEQWKDK